MARPNTATANRTRPTTPNRAPGLRTVEPAADFRLMEMENRLKMESVARRNAEKELAEIENAFVEISDEENKELLTGVGETISETVGAVAAGLLHRKGQSRRRQNIGLVVGLASAGINAAKPQRAGVRIGTAFGKGLWLGSVSCRVADL